MKNVLDLLQCWQCRRSVKSTNTAHEGTIHRNARVHGSAKRRIMTRSTDQQSEKDRLHQALLTVPSIQTCPLAKRTRSNWNDSISVTIFALKVATVQIDCLLKNDENFLKHNPSEQSSSDAPWNAGCYVTKSRIPLGKLPSRLVFQPIGIWANRKKIESGAAVLWGHHEHFFEATMVNFSICLNRVLSFNSLLMKDVR